MAEGIEDGLDDGIEQGQEDNDEDGYEEVIGCSIIVSQLFGAVRTTRESLSK